MSKELYNHKAAMARYPRGRDHEAHKASILRCGCRLVIDAFTLSVRAVGGSRVVERRQDYTRRLSRQRRRLCKRAARDDALEAYFPQREAIFGVRPCARRRRERENGISGRLRTICPRGFRRNGKASDEDRSNERCLPVGVELDRYSGEPQLLQREQPMRCIL